MSAARPVRREGGFTLLEVLAALTVFLVGVVGIISLLTSATRLHQQSQNALSVSEVLGEVELLVRREVALASLGPAAAGADGPVEPVVVPGHDRFRYTWSLSGGDGGMPWVVDLTLLWKEGGVEQSFERRLVLDQRRPLGPWVRSSR